MAWILSTKSLQAPSALLSAVLKSAEIIPSQPWRTDFRSISLITSSRLTVESSWRGHCERRRQVFVPLIDFRPLLFLRRSCLMGGGRAYILRFLLMTSMELRLTPIGYQSFFVWKKAISPSEKFNPWRANCGRDRRGCLESAGSY